MPPATRTAASSCIDKLYSPDSCGRARLLELQTPRCHRPLAWASSWQLPRALVARFWIAPYEASLVRWGTELHDRFLLPHFIEHDFADVMLEMTDAGMAFDGDWFAPHLEFRFPMIGEFAAGGVHVTLRSALEPWHVMGEEGSAGGTVRYVDASLERIEVKVTGLIEPRHVLAVNGQPVPLQPTGRVGRIRRGRALPRVAAALGIAPDDPRARHR